MTMVSLIPPHGGTLVDRVVAPEETGDALRAAAALTAVQLTPSQHSDLLCIATGVFSPLTGFVGRDDYESILDRMRLANGIVWSIPVTLAVTTEIASRVAEGTAVALEDSRGTIIATMEVRERFTYDKRREAASVY